MRTNEIVHNQNKTFETYWHFFIQFQSENIFSEIMLCIYRVFGTRLSENDFVKTLFLLTQYFEALCYINDVKVGCDTSVFVKKNSR